MSEAMKVRATAMGFLGKLRMPGEVFVIDSEKAFASSWMEKVDEAVKETAAPALQFAVKHVGGGNWIVVKNEDDSRASRMFKKGAKGEAEGLAQAEAERLNAGGQMLLDAVPQQDAPPAGDGNLPDA